MRSRRKSLNQEAAELNITAFMNLMVILVPFLLITAVFSRMTVLELNLPGLDGSSGDEQEVKLQLQLVVHSDYWLVQDGNLGEIKRIEHTDNDRHSHSFANSYEPSHDSHSFANGHQHDHTYHTTLNLGPVAGVPAASHTLGICSVFVGNTKYGKKMSSIFGFLAATPPKNQIYYAHYLSEFRIT